MKPVTYRSPLRYPGGKYRARKILMDYVPEGTSHVVSPFVGGASFELALTEKEIKVSAYDGFTLLSSFWECLTEDAEKLSSAIRETPDVQPGLFKEMQTTLKGFTHGESIPENRKFSLAAQFFIVNRCSYSGATLSGGYSKESARTRYTPSSVDRIERFHNPLLSVSEALFETVLGRIDDSVDLLFLDPPYMLEGTKNRLYGIGGDLHKEFNHERLHELTVSSGKPFILTYNNTPEVHDLWKGYTTHEAQWAYGMNTSKKSSELIITNIKE